MMTQTLPTPKSGRFHQGYYTPLHPEKYVGNVNKIRYMSSWELHLHKFCDNNPNVLAWAAEGIAIPYIKPTDKHQHKYYPDYWIRFKDRYGNIREEILEIKPKSQTRPSRSRKTNNKIYENIQYAVNVAKWEAAVKWCEYMSNKTGRKITFRIATEESLFR